MAGKASGWAAWKSKTGQANKFTGMVGRESKKASGKQGMHHHPQMSQLGNAVMGGLKPGGFAKPKGL